MLRHTLLVSALVCCAGCMSESRLLEALTFQEADKAAAEEAEFLGWLKESEGDAPLRYRAVETAVTLHARGGTPENAALLQEVLRAEYAAPRLDPEDPDTPAEARRLRAWILYQCGRLKDPAWIPFLLEQTAEALAAPADDGRGAAGLRGLAEPVEAVASDGQAAQEVLRLAAIAASRPQDPQLAQTGALVAFLRERLSDPARLAALAGAATAPEVHAVLVRWAAAALHEACAPSAATAPGACEPLLAQLLAEEAGRSGAELAAVARAALAARAPLHLLHGLAARLQAQADDARADDLAAALAIAAEVQAAHPAAGAAGVWEQGGLRRLVEPSLAAAEAWQADRAAAVQVLFASAGRLAARPADRERLLGILATLAPAETAVRLVEEAPPPPGEPAAHARLEQVARHLVALLATPGVEAAAVQAALGRLAGVPAEAVHRTAAACLAERDPAAYLAASAALRQELPGLVPGLADAVIDGAILALAKAPEGLDQALRGAALASLALAFRRSGDEDARHDRVYACLAPRDATVLADAIASQLAAGLAAAGPGLRQVLRGCNALPLTRELPAGETPLVAQLLAIAGREPEEPALLAARALAEQRTEAATAALRQLAEHAASRAVAALAAAALAGNPKP